MGSTAAGPDGVPGTGPGSQPGPGNWQRRLPAEPGALFAYGTLQFPEVLQALLRRLPDREPAQVTGWRVAALGRGRNYPGLVPAPGATTEGMLITGLTAEEWQLIDLYEDDFYDLQQLTLTDNRSGLTYTWIANDQVVPADWSAQSFADLYLAEFTQWCQTWRDRYDATGHPGHVTHQL
jgi:hypothetical protein